MAGREIKKCKHCAKLLVQPRGPVNAEILAIGGEPDWMDVKKGIHYSTGGWKKRVGDVLESEFQRAGINPARVRYTNVWKHTPDKQCNENYHTTEAFKEVVGVKYIFLMGTTALRLFLPDAKVSEWSGLEIVSPNIPKGSRAIAVAKPTMALGDTLGEVRHAVEKLSEIIHEDN